MTIDEVKRCIDEEGVIECNDLSQRDEALQFLVDIGYKLHPSTKSWIEENPGSTEFIHPGLSGVTSWLTLWSTTANKTVISFAHIAELIIQNDASIDERNIEEFSEAFAALMD